MATTRDEYREWLTSTGKHEGQQLSEWAQNLVRTFGLEGALDLLSVTGDSNLYGVDLRRSPWAGRPWLRRLVERARETDLELSRALYGIVKDPQWSPPCPACDHPTDRHYGRWCRVPTGEVNVSGEAMICGCSAVDRGGDR